MSIEIRTKRPNHNEENELYPSEEIGRKALRKNLDAHRARGHLVSSNRTETLFTVRDKGGKLLQESEIISSV